MVKQELLHLHSADRLCCLNDRVRSMFSPMFERERERERGKKYLRVVDAGCVAFTHGPGKVVPNVVQTQQKSVRMSRWRRIEPG
jgi:hypothetical protein